MRLANIWDAAPRNPIGHAPPRRPGSVRRTSTLDSTWPDGPQGTWFMAGRARDLFTPVVGEPSILAQAHIDMTITPERAIASIASTPPDERLQALVGARGGGHLRSVIEAALPGEREAGTPLYLLLDDISGASLVARWAWSRWQGDWAAVGRPGGPRNMENICTGFQTGSSALGEGGVSHSEQNSAVVPPLQRPDDPIGWHPLAEHAGVSMRRARRIDVWLGDGVIHIDSGFQDSASLPQGGRAAVHEYGLQATADAATGRLLSAVADPRVLPYRECPAAPANLDRLLGVPLEDLRAQVPVTLKGPLGCTHLNDAMRALSEAALLARQLGQAA